MGTASGIAMGLAIGLCVGIGIGAAISRPRPAPPGRIHDRGPDRWELDRGSEERGRVRSPGWKREKDRLWHRRRDDLGASADPVERAPARLPGEVPGRSGWKPLDVRATRET